jgi:glucosamine 6-phosphate synthetase-like amidotransferase/phosphosugar isomerase protein
MCGIAGYDLASLADLPAWVREHPLGAPTVLARLLLSALSERGADAAGYAATDGAHVEMVKHAGSATEFIAGTQLDPQAWRAMVHIRDYTKGLPGLDANNHPVRHGSMLAVHNGRIANDEELFVQLGEVRDAPGMTVDSAAIAMLATRMDIHDVPSALVGSYACALLDEHSPGQLKLLRGNGRPLHVCEREHGVYFASTLEAMSWLAGHMDWHDALIERVADGTGLILQDGRVAERFRFEVNPYTEEPFGGYDWDESAATSLRAAVVESLRQ